MNILDNPAVRQLVDAFSYEIIEASRAALLEEIRAKVQSSMLAIVPAGRSSVTRRLPGKAGRPSLKSKGPRRSLYMKPKAAKVVPTLTSVSTEAIEKVHVAILNSTVKHTSTELADKAGISDSSTRATLKVLQNLNKVTSTNEGRRVLYSAV